MNEGVLNLNSASEFLNLDFSEPNLPSKITFHPFEDLPFREGVSSNPGFEVNESCMPYNYRKKYFHPGLYFSNIFNDEYKHKLNDLRTFLKGDRNKRTIIFIVDVDSPESLLNACCLMGELFYDCGNPVDTTYKDVTNVPFPLKISDDAPHLWIWSCHWPAELKSRLESGQKVNEFINQAKFDFPEYDSRFFPVRPLFYNNVEKGVTAFSVRLGGGSEMIISPQCCLNELLSCSEKHNPAPEKTEAGSVIIEVMSFPEEIKFSNKKEVTLKISDKENEDTVSTLNFLRFLAVYHASQGKGFFGYKLNEGKVSEISYFSSDEKSTRGIAFPYKFLFYTATGEKDANFSTLLSNMEECALRRLSVAEKEGITSVIYKRIGPKERYRHEGYLIEKFQNLQIRFSSQAKENFRQAKLPEDSASSDNMHLAGLHDKLTQFKHDLLPII